MSLTHSLPKAVALSTLLLVGGGVIGWPGGSPDTAEGAGAPFHHFHPGRTDRKLRTPASGPCARTEARRADDPWEGLRSLLRDDPERACREALARGKEAAAAMAAEWLKLDRDAVIRWAASLDGEARDIVLATLAIELAGGDPRLATEVAFMMGEGTGRNEVLAFVASQWATGQPADGLQWVRELEDPRMRGVVERQLLPAIAARDPLMAVAYVTEEMPDPEARLGVVPGILQRWVQADPEAAIDWARRISDPVLRGHSLEAAMRVWADADPDRINGWWSGQPADSFRDEVSAVMAGILAQSDRRTALRYAESIDGGDLRSSARERAAAR